ncbi:hypothetical protein QQX98_011492 [Neonectria punicea]|uniref:ATPase AAA-type core domain-containing protein n=1 Tax=Neonectria punicea TaxID=979145 RepID=A0ABR1GLU4_9HYPO
MTDESLMSLTTRLPRRCLLLIEDIDAAGLGRNLSGSEQGITLSGYLNATDGFIAPEGHISFITTNNPQSLDLAIKRPGRVDYDVYLTNASKSQAEQLFQNNYCASIHEDLESTAQKFTDKVPEFLFSPTEIQQYLLKLEHCDSPETALADAPAWRSHGDAKILEDLQKEASSLLEIPFLAVTPADSSNQNPSYDLGEQKALHKIGVFTQRHLSRTQLLRFRVQIANPKAQEAGQDEENDALGTKYDSLKAALKSVVELSEEMTTECLREGLSASRVQELREALEEANSLAEKESEDVSIVNKDTEERADAITDDFNVVTAVDDAVAHPAIKMQKQQELANLDSENDQKEERFITGQDQLPHTLQTRKRQMLLLSPEQHHRPSKRRS